MTTRRERLRRKRHRRSYVMTTGHRHRKRLNSFAYRLDERVKVLKLGAWVLGVMLLVSGVIFINNSGTHFIGFICLTLLWVMIATVDNTVSMLTDRASLLRVETPGEKLLRDKRAPVLYLRPFVRDAEASKIYKTQRTQLFVNGIQVKQTVVVKTTTGSEEDHIVNFFDRVGPVVAIGNPSDTTPTIGAARYYLNKQELWKMYDQQGGRGDNQVFNNLSPPLWFTLNQRAGVRPLHGPPNFQRLPTLPSQLWQLGAKSWCRLCQIVCPGTFTNRCSPLEPTSDHDPTST